MNTNYFFSSLTRITDLQERRFEVLKTPQKEWSMGDFVVGEIDASPSPFPIELFNGRMIVVAEGDLVIGALGTRHATLEATGDWRLIGDDGAMHALTGAGLIGSCTSRSTLLPPLLAMHYQGHVCSKGETLNMMGFVPRIEERPFELPVILIIGTSMSSGKTTVGRIIVRQLKRLGLKVIGAKLTGAGRYRDILSLKDAGADHIFDFVDVGLPSTICPDDQYKGAARQLLSRMAGVDADIAVIEVGASPLEPYNGEAAIELLRPNIAFKVLCSSDPYAVVGVMSAFNLRPDLVSGVTTSTRAGIELVERLADVPALNLMNKQSHAGLLALLGDKLNLANLLHPTQTDAV